MSSTSSKSPRRAALGLGLGAAALISLAPARPAAAQGSPSGVSSHNYTYTVDFTTPAAFLNAGPGDIRFEFDPSGPSPAVAQITGGNLTYSSDWLVDPTGVTMFGNANPGYSFSGPITGLDVVIGNSMAHNGFQLPVTQWGKTFGFTFIYADPPGTDPSDFTLALQAPGQTDASLFDVQFSPSGTATLMGSASGVGITPQGGAPALLPPSVPEASTTVSLGLLLALGLGGLVVAAKRRKAAATASL